MKPKPTRTKINRGHPLAKDLVGFALFNEGALVEAQGFYNVQTFDYALSIDEIKELCEVNRVS